VRRSAEFQPGCDADAVSHVFARARRSRGAVNHDDTQTQTDPLDHPDVAKHLSADLRAILKRVDDGDEAARTEALAPVAALIDAFAAVGLLEFAYLAPGHDEEEDGPIAWFEASEAIVDKDRDSVVVAGSEILEVFDGPITLEDPPEHEGEE
jgi:hypothetical protein